MEPLYKMRLTFFFIGTISAILCFILKSVLESEEVTTSKLLYNLIERQYLRSSALAILFLSIGFFTFPFGPLLKSIFALF